MWQAAKLAQFIVEKRFVLSLRLPSASKSGEEPDAFAPFVQPTPQSDS